MCLSLPSEVRTVVRSAVVHVVNDMDGLGSFSARQPVCSLRQHRACPTSVAADMLVETAPCLLRELAKASLPELPPQLFVAFLPPDQPVCQLARPALQS